MKLTILVIAVLSCVAGASGFPPDPPGTDVIDRALFTTYTAYGTIEFYIILYNDEDRGTIRIDRHLDEDWETVYTCNPRDFSDAFIVFDPITVLSMQEYRGSLLMSWIDRFEYHEGLSSFYIDYNYKLGVWDEYWMD